ncbi:MAG TPA: ankyrin repeat domain-containing protein [Candidatus Hydrogenedentes bacterium]|nr:ankyrin repeat domain-containing protein [Candidatus Hydrogenedentota bacterium]HIJ73325.1 ankyrin repeat domain-containing protein [Candidatus Hydrogenedentota bacterium]
MKQRLFLGMAVVATLVVAGLAAAQAASGSEAKTTEPESLEEFMKAVEQKDIAKVQELLSKNPMLINARDKKGATALHKAVELPAARPPRPMGPPAEPPAADLPPRPMRPPAERRPPEELMKARQEAMDKMLANQKELTTLLLEKGADLDAKDEAGATPLHKAVEMPAPRVPPPRAGRTPEQQEMMKERMQVDQDMLKRMMAGRQDLAGLLLERGANVNIQDAAGATPLLKAIETPVRAAPPAPPAEAPAEEAPAEEAPAEEAPAEEAPAEEALAEEPPAEEAPAELTEAQEELMKAMKERQAGMAEMLLKRGANPAIKNKAGVTIEQKAKEMNREDLLEILKKYGAPQ